MKDSKVSLLHATPNDSGLWALTELLSIDEDAWLAGFPEGNGAHGAASPSAQQPKEPKHWSQTL